MYIETWKKKEKRIKEQMSKTKQNENNKDRKKRDIT